MNKVELLEHYISNIIQIVENDDEDEAYICIRNITSTFAMEIENIHEDLTNYYYDVGSYTDDLKILLSRLMNYKSNLKLEKEVRDYELKKLELEKDVLINREEKSNNKIETISNQFKKTIESLYYIEDSILVKEEKEILENMLAAIELAQNANDKYKVEEKVINIIKYVYDKDKSIILIMLPYLGEIISKLNF